MSWQRRFLIPTVLGVQIGLWPYVGMFGHVCLYLFVSSALDWIYGGRR